MEKELREHLAAAESKLKANLANQLSAADQLIAHVNGNLAAIRKSVDHLPELIMCDRRTAGSDYDQRTKLTGDLLQVVFQFAQLITNCQVSLSESISRANDLEFLNAALRRLRSCSAVISLIQGILSATLDFMESGSAATRITDLRII